MLETIGVSSIDDLFDEIPPDLRAGDLSAIPEGAPEMQVNQIMQRAAHKDGQPICFIGAGAYDHHIPSAVWQITTRGEFYSAYTPYQAEASQGTLQLIYEFQTMMTGLTGLDVSNASLYDGASGLAEALLMAIRGNRKSKSRRVLVPTTVHPHYRKTAHTIVHTQGIDMVELPYDAAGGHTLPDTLAAYDGEDIAAVVIQQPNFFGILEEVDAITDWAHRNGALVIAIANPTSLALLKPPGEWGEQGADIACGEGQPLGVPMMAGGPYFGYMCCKQALVRQMPGRIVGRTVDRDGRDGFTLTLQAREQHIRRSKATSNICTNQGLLVTAATIYMSLLGAEGLRRVAQASHANTRSLVAALTQDGQAEPVFNRPYFHEAALRLSAPLDGVMQACHAQNILPGYDLSKEYPELENCLLVCATETKTDADIASFADQLHRASAELAATDAPANPVTA